MSNQYEKDVFWVRFGRMVVVGLISLVVIAVLAGPAIGWYVDTRIYPGTPATTRTETITDDAGHQTVQQYKYDQDTGAVEYWLLLPYTLYGVILLIVGGIAVGSKVSESRQNLSRGHGHMAHIFDPLPPNKNVKALLEAERRDLEVEEIKVERMMAGARYR